MFDIILWHIWFLPYHENMHSNLPLSFLHASSVGTISILNVCSWMISGFTYCKSIKVAHGVKLPSNAHFQDRDSRNQFQISLVFLMNNTSPCKEKENLHGKYNGEKDTYVQTSYFMS